MHKRNLKLSSFIIVFTGVVSLALSSGALAEEVKPCAEDAQKFCRGKLPGGGVISSCLRKHESELSLTCKAVFAEAQSDYELVKFIDQIEGISTTKNVEVVLVASPISYLLGPLNNTIRGFGCSVVTRDSSRIRSFIDLLRRNVRDADGAPRTSAGWSLQEEIHLTLANGDEVALLLGGLEYDDLVRGTFSRPPAGARTSVVANKSYLSELYLWVSETNELKPGVFCNRRSIEEGLKKLESLPPVKKSRSGEGKVQ